MKLLQRGVNLVVRGRFGRSIMFRRVVFVAAIIAPVAGLSGCAGGRVYTAANLADSVSAQPVGYLVGPGDTLQIFVWDQPDLSTNVRVRPDGRISTPLVEDLEAVGRTPTELAREIENVLSEYVRSPVVTVIVQDFVGESTQQIRVVGQAVEPRAIQYREGMTVLDVIIEVGGLSEFAAGNRASIIRQIDGENARIRIRLEDLLDDGRIEENVRMVPGDVLIIPESLL